MSKFKKTLLAVCVIGYSFAGQAFGGEPCTRRVVSVSTFVVSQPERMENLDDLLGRLEALMEPVHQKVVVCNQELEQAQATVDSLSSQLVGAIAQRDKAVKGLRVLKTALEQPGCHVEIGSCSYSRETVGAAVELKLAEHASSCLAIKSKTVQLVAAQRVLEDTSAKVARWIAKEKELLSQIDKVDAEGIVESAELTKIIEKGNQLRLSINEMLKPAGRATQVENSQLVAEIDAALSSN